MPNTIRNRFLCVNPAGALSGDSSEWHLNGTDSCLVLTVLCDGQSHFFSAKGTKLTHSSSDQPLASVRFLWTEYRCPMLPSALLHCVLHIHFVSLLSSHLHPGFAGSPGH